MHRPSRRLLRRMEQIERLPRRKQAALLTTIDAFLNSATGRVTSLIGERRQPLMAGTSPKREQQSRATIGSRVSGLDP
jgi:hypothetical protein